MSLPEYVALTDVGLRREANEDSHAVVELDGALLCIVADGMGGHAAGEVASRIAVEELSAAAGEALGEGGLERLADAARKAHWTIVEQARGGQEGMGCTLTAALVQPGRVGLVHVGDSRAYFLTPGSAVQLTDDDSLVGDLVRSRTLTTAQARVHPYRSVLTKAMGIGGDPSVATLTVDTPADALLLLCSDGLTEHVDDDHLVELAMGAETLGGLATTLVQAANDGGGTDNITVVLVRCPAGA